MRLVAPGKHMMLVSFKLPGAGGVRRAMRYVVFARVRVCYPCRSPFIHEGGAP